MAITELAPAPRPIGIFPRFIAQTSETLVLKEKILSLSGDSFDIKNASSNHPAFKVKGEALTLSGRKHLLDANGDSVFDIRKEHFTLHKTFYGQDESGNHLFEVKKKLKRGFSLHICIITEIGWLILNSDWIKSYLFFHFDGRPRRRIGYGGRLS